jgi:phage gp29-like protein
MIKEACQQVDGKVNFADYDSDGDGYVDLAGYPVLIGPEGLDLWNTQDEDMRLYLAAAETMVKTVRRDEREGLVLPNGWEFKLLSSGGSRAYDTSKIIERYDTRIAQTMLADFILIGHQQTGSFALSSDKTEMFSMAIGAYLDTIAQAFNNQAIPRLVELNKEKFSGISGFPTMEHGDVETPNLAEIGAFIKDMTGIGIIVPDGALEQYVRQVADLPEKEEGSERPLPNLTPQQQEEQEKQQEEEDNKDKADAETAKRILKRIQNGGE